MKTFILFFVLLFASNSYANEFLSVEPPELNDPELKGMQWNRYVSGRFTILSVDDETGRNLAEVVNPIKSEILSKWNFADFELQHEIRIFCVPNQSILKKLFGTSEEKFENRLDTEDKVLAIWITLPSGFSAKSPTIYAHISQAVFSEYEALSGIKLGYWFIEGARTLNGHPAAVKETLQPLASGVQSGEIFFSKSVLEMDKDTYLELSKENKALYDAEATALCLMLRKEFGQVKLNSFFKNANHDYDAVFPKVYGFKNCKDFDSKFTVYLKDLSKCNTEGRIPSDYLTIEGK